MLTLTYEYKAKPTDEQIKLIEHTLDICRQVWNFALRERRTGLILVSQRLMLVQ